MALPSPGPAGLAASFGLHALLLAAALLLVRPAMLPDSEEQVVLVDLVVAATEDATEAVAIAPAEAEGAGGGAAPVEIAGQADPAGADDMVTATALLAAGVFADPRNSQARAMLDMIVPAVRREQVCGVEAMEQIKLASAEAAPECVISYAFAETESEGDRLLAPGAAVLIGADWFRLDYDCTLGAAPGSVTAFRYRIGEMISTEDVDRLGLATCR